MIRISHLVNNTVFQSDELAAIERFLKEALNEACKASDADAEASIMEY